MSAVTVFISVTLMRGLFLGSESLSITIRMNFSQSDSVQLSGIWANSGSRLNFVTKSKLNFYFKFTDTQSYSW